MFCRGGWMAEDGCLHRPFRKKALPVAAPALNSSHKNLLSIAIGDLEKAGVSRSSKPASKAPLTSAPGDAANGKDYDEEDLRKEIFMNMRGLEPVSTSRHDNNRRWTVKETTRAIRREDSDGSKMINEYVRDSKIGTGSYGKVVLYKSTTNNRMYAIKIFHKSRLRKLRVAPAETAMMDVLREVAIMKNLRHPNIVRLIEVIDDPESDYFYMVLEYMEGGWIFEGSGPVGGIREELARSYFNDVVAGLTYLHQNKIVHGDIKPENLLISRDGRLKIADFGVSQLFVNENDELWRSPGTPVFTAPECCLGKAYGGRAADVWALGCTLYCMVFGRYPFLGSSLHSTYEKVLHEDIDYPHDVDPDLHDLLSRLLRKDPNQRLTLDAVACHPWVVKSSDSSKPSEAS